MVPGTKHESVGRRHLESELTRRYKKGDFECSTAHRE